MSGEWDFLEGAELRLATKVITQLWEAQTTCSNLQSYRYSAIDSCRSLLMCRVPDGQLPDMPEGRFPEGGDGRLTPKEAATVLAAAKGLHRVDKELESSKARYRQVLGNHGDLLEEAVRDYLGPVNPTKRDRSLKARGAALVRGLG